MRLAHLALAALMAAMGLVVHAQRSLPTPREVVEELLATDNGFSEASRGTDLASGLSAMFAADVVMPLPGGRLAKSRDEAEQALRANPTNASARAEWTPIRGGVSADGRHGFTFGYMTVTGQDGSKTPVKYLAYWIKRDAGWRVAVYKRGRAEQSPTSIAPMDPALPSALKPVTTDEALIARYRSSLDAAERAFSDEAQKIGIGPAFVKYGSADAVNMGPPNEPRFIVGSEAIGRSVGAGYTADRPGVSWAPDQTIVASSGDLGVTIGFIRASGPGPDGKTPPPFPFFTIWRRASPEGTWRYIAE